MQRVVIYVRVSTQEQAKEGYSIGEQIERLKKYCEAMGWLIVKIYIDAGESGGDTNRPELQSMIQEIEGGNIDKVVVYKLDRLSRSQKDTLNLIEDVFLVNNTDFVSMQENFDTSTPFGRAMIGILAVFAQLEREQIKERMIMGQDARAKEGKWRGGGPTPVGYNYINGELQINPLAAMMVRELFERFTNNEPITRIEKSFDEKGYNSSEKKWTAKNMGYVLKNKVYIGYMRHRGEWLKGNHDPIIDLDTFDLASKILKEEKEQYEKTGIKRGANSHTTHLSGLIRCKHCNSKFGKNNTGNKKYGFHENYMCYSRSKKTKSMIKDRNCKNKYYRVETLDNMIFDEIKKLKIDPDYIHTLKGEKKHNNLEIEAIKKEIQELDAQRSRFMDLYGIGKYTVKELDGKTEPLQVRKNKLLNTLSDLTESSYSLSNDEALQIINDFEKLLKMGNIDEIRQAIQSLIEYIEIDNDDISIHWNFV